MRVLLISAHPSPDSFVSALRRRIRETLASQGHAIDDLDLYAEGFDPVMRLESFAHYSDPARNAEGVEPYVARLQAADALALAFPVWCDGLPAILQGYFQRVFLPGVAFTMDAQGRFHRKLANIRRLAGVASYGASEATLRLQGDPPRRFVCEHLAGLVAPDVKVEYFGHYGMNASTLARRRAFLEEVSERFAAWGRGAGAE